MATSFFDKYFTNLPMDVLAFVLGTLLLAIFCSALANLILYKYADASYRDPQIRGCRKLGLQTASNLRDEFNKRYGIGTSQPEPNSTGKQWKVKSLWIYPVKSCRGVELAKGTIISTGMEYDRQFTFAQLRSPFPVSLDRSKDERGAHYWEFITQRSFPLLALVKTEIWIPDPSLATYSASEPDVQSGGVIVLKFPYVEDGWKGLLFQLAAVARGGQRFEKHVKIPFNPTPAEIKKNGYKMESVKIWKDWPVALNMEPIVSPELKYFLGVPNPLALFRMDTKNFREVYRCAPRKEEVGYQPLIGFADAYPLHLLSLASVHDVAAKLEKGGPKLSALRFRPNIIVTGPKAYAEDTWKKIKIGEDEYYVSCRTVRCKLPNVDQNTGKKHPSEPDRTLRSFRCVDEGARNSACLGMQMVPASAQSVIKIGDKIEVLETGEHYYINQ